MSYQFAGSLYNSQNELVDAIVGEWITGGGNNDCAQVSEAFSSNTNEALTSELLEQWNDGEETGDYGQCSGVGADELVEGFDRMRDNFKQITVEFGGKTYCLDMDYRGTEMVGDLSVDGIAAGSGVVRAYGFEDCPVPLDEEVYCAIDNALSEAGITR